MGLTTISSSSPSYPVMPDFTQATSEFSHTVDSAMEVLDALGIAESRLTLQMAGPGVQALRIVRQLPVPGTTLTPSVAVTLWVSGFGLFYGLPMPMRESGGEAEIGTREFCRLFDDPLQKSARWFRTGIPLFKIGPDKHAMCRRWIALFGLDPLEWPEELLYPLALLVPTLAKLAGREVGVRLVFLTLLGLPVYKFHYRATYRSLEPEQRSRLGARACRLGRDFIAGDRQADADSVTVQLGPVSLAVYMSFQQQSSRRLMQVVSDLCMSAYQRYSVTWLVEDVRQAPRLGVASQNSRIGLNFHLGKGANA